MSPRLLAAACLFVGAALGYLVSGRAVPSVAHVIFIPSAILFGVVLGFVFGGRAARDELAGQARAAEAKAARRAAREGK